VFMALVATNRVLRSEGAQDVPLMDLLDLVALATVADVVPLIALNRAFVTQGLAVMRRRERPGLRALFDVSRLDGPPAPYHLGFMIGPRINAGGRIGDAALGARLLISDDDEESRRMAQTLDDLNKDRQVIEAQALEDGNAQAEQQLMANADAAALLVGSPDWHPGVVGLVAARLKERYRRPAFAIAWGEGGQGTGSGRSVPGVDLGAAVRGAVDAGLLIKGGGHAMAAGITVSRSRAAGFADWLQAKLHAAADAFRQDATLRIDGLITAGAATPSLVTALEKAGPFGSASPEPVFALPNHIVADAVIVGAQDHVRVRLKAGDGKSLNAIAFRAGSQPLGQALRAHTGQPVHVAGSLTIDRWGGAERTQLRIIDISPVMGRARAS
ncbi:MAG: single-stranded-DNA-specific exonuclease RecJ, partial [Beijerinckiaceae bacterium]